MRQRALSFWFVIFLSVTFFICGIAATGGQVKDEDAALDVGTHEVAW